MLNFVKAFAAVALAGVLTACGGGGGSAGTNPNAPTVTIPVAATATLAALTVNGFTTELSKSSLSNSGGDFVLLTVTALNTINNPIAGASVTVAPDSGVYSPISSVTDVNGKATGNITIGGNKANRNITALVSVGGVTKTVVIPVTGSNITLSVLPETPVPGQTVTLRIVASDASSVGLSNIPVNLSGSAGFSGSVTTDSSGNATTTTLAPSSGTGSFSIVATGSGAVATRFITVISGAGGTIPDAVGVVSSASANPNPNTIAPNLSGGTTNSSQVVARFFNSSNAGIQNIRVRFELVAPALGAGESLTSGNSVVYTDAAGVASTNYVAGTRSSPTNGVQIRACYSSADFAVGTCPNSVTTTLTVNGQPLAVSIGADNTQTKGLGGISYIRQFLIQVADSAGTAVPNAVVSASVDITHYAKGQFSASTYFGSGARPPTIADTYSTTLSASEVPTATYRVWCINEDLNRNGVFDSGEDFDGNSVMEPNKSEVVLSYVSGNKTDVNGQLLIQVLYPQNMATWLAYTIKASTSVAGSEGTSQKSFFTTALQVDVENGSFRTPQFGVNACNTRD